MKLEDPQVWAALVSLGVMLFVGIVTVLIACAVFAWWALNYIGIIS